MPSVITLEITDGFIPSVMLPREKNFWRARIRLYYRRCFHRWVVFLFATELATEMGFTDDCYTDGRVSSVSPSVWFSPMDFIAVTDGMSPSVKLDNVVVRVLSMAGHLCLIKSVLNSLVIYFMYVFKMSKGVGRLLSSIQRRFLWCGCTKQRSFCKIQ